MSRRLIELSIPLDPISAQSACEKSIRHGHISTLHIWWARRPLAACRAAVFAALVDAPEDDAQRERLERLIATIVDWDQVKDGNSPAIEEARRIIREQWGDETPRVLDMFADSGAIPLEALRLGCQAHALELNPVAYLILLCTLVYPQKYGQMGKSANHATRTTPTSAARLPGMEDVPETLQNPLADDVRHWGQWVLEEARKEIGQFCEPVQPPLVTPGERRYRRVVVRTPVRWENWQDFYDEVVDPLIREGAEVSIDVEVAAESESGIRENTVELGIRESLYQRGARPEIETEE